MITLNELVNFLTSKTTNTNDYINSLKSAKRLDSKIYNEYNFEVTNFSYNDTLNNLLFCLLYTGVIPGYDISLISESNDNFDRKIINLNDQIITDVRDKLIGYLNDNKYLIPFSKKKIINFINNNQYNHELILIIAGIYEINIFIFYKDINLFKVYYPDEKLLITKNNVFLQYNKDIYSSSNTFQIMSMNNNYILKWNQFSNLIKENLTNIYPIGLDENKKLVIEESLNHTYENVFINKNDMVYIYNYIFNNNYICDINFYNKIIQRPLLLANSTS